MPFLSRPGCLFGRISGLSNNRLELCPARYSICNRIGQISRHLSLYKKANNFVQKTIIVLETVFRILLNIQLGVYEKSGKMQKTLSHKKMSLYRKCSLSHDFSAPVFFPDPDLTLFFCVGICQKSGSYLEANWLIQTREKSTIRIRKKTGSELLAK